MAQESKMHSQQIQALEDKMAQESKMHSQEVQGLEDKMANEYEMHSQQIQQQLQNQDRLQNFILDKDQQISQLQEQLNSQFQQEEYAK